MKRYVTYTRKKIGNNFYADPNTNNGVYENTQGAITLHETPFQVDGAFISWIEYDDDLISIQNIEYFRTLDPEFNFTILDEEKVNQLLSNLGDVSVKDFEFTDNRDLEELLTK